MLVFTIVQVHILVTIVHKLVYIHVLLNGSYLAQLLLIPVYSLAKIINLLINYIQQDRVLAEIHVLIVILLIIKLRGVFLHVLKLNHFIMKIFLQVVVLWHVLVKVTRIILIKLVYIVLWQLADMYQIAQELTLLIHWQKLVLNFVLLDTLLKLHLSIVLQHAQGFNLLIILQEHVLQLAHCIIFHLMSILLHKFVFSFAQVLIMLKTQPRAVFLDVPVYWLCHKHVLANHIAHNRITQIGLNISVY